MACGLDSVLWVLLVVVAAAQTDMQLQYVIRWALHLASDVSTLQ